MGAIASLITSLTIVYSTVYSDADQRKHQSSASLTFVGKIHRHKWPVTRKMFPLDNVIMSTNYTILKVCCLYQWKWDVTKTLLGSSPSVVKQPPDASTTPFVGHFELCPICETLIILNRQWPQNLHRNRIEFNSLAPGKFEWNYRCVIFKQILVTEGSGISYEIALIWMSLDFTDDQSTLVKVMAWCRQATSHYLSQCWPRSLPPYGVTRPQCVNSEHSASW